MVLDINKKKQQTGEQKWRFLSQKWGTTISRMVPIQSDLATHKKMARRQHGMLYIAGLQILILILSTARESDMNKHDDFEHLWTTALNTHIYIYIYVPTRVVGASCFLFSDFFPHVYLCWPWWPSSVSRADRWRSGRNPAGTWEPSLPEAKEADLFPWYEYYDVNACYCMLMDVNWC